MAFEFYINKSGITQGIYAKHMMPVVVPAYGMVEKSSVSSMGWGFSKVKNVLDEMDQLNKKRLYIHRTFALGDILMLVPVVRLLKKMGYDSYLSTNRSMLGLLGLLGIPAEDARGVWQGPGVDVDGLVEMDHIVPELSMMHRVMIYMSVFGLSPKRSEIDWNCDISRFPNLSFDVSEKFVVFQGAGGNERKTLPMETVLFILKQLLSKGYNIIYLGDHRSIDIENSKLKVLSDSRISTPEVFTLLSKASALVCMDSGPLWISHFTSTPTMTIFGPTSWKQRLTLHPLYPDRVNWIELSKAIGCEPCYESKKDCNGKLSCLEANATWISEKVLGWLSNVSQA